MRKLLIILISLQLSHIAMAANKSEIDTSDNMLDRLERKLLEQEAATLRIQAPPRTPAQTKPEKKLRIPAQTVSGSMPSSDDFAPIDRKLEEIENQVEDLSQRVEKLQSTIMEKSEKGSLVEIQVSLDEPDTTALRELTVTIDQHVIYQLGKDINPWIPTSQIMVFTGPLEPGKHTLELKALTLRRYSDKLPLDSKLFHTYAQELKIDIPSGQFRRGFKLKLAKPEKQNTYALAIMESYEIP